MSTVGPDDARNLGRRLAERGHRLVDAPVSGGAEGAAAGSLAIMAGGATEDVERCRPLFDAFAANVFHVGEEVGTGQSAKLVNQLLVAAHLVATAEALALGVRNGVDARQLCEIISTAAGDSRIFRSRAPVIVDRTFKTGGAVNILVKDARLVLKAAESSGTPLFVAAAAKQVLEMARALGLGDEDDASVAKAYELLGGREIR
jgi:putative dehydrogenase